MMIIINVKCVALLLFAGVVCITVRGQETAKMNTDCLSLKMIEQKPPTGFFIYRNHQTDWKARTPTWRREGSLTDPYLYYWLPLRPAERIEFEYSDLSRIEGERSIAIYINDSPCHDKRVELLAVPFKIRKS